MKPDPDVPRIRLSSPSDIVDAVPYLVGFQPHESIVVLSIGRGKQLGFSVRADLPSLEGAQSVASQLVEYLEHDDAMHAIAVIYPASGGPVYPVVQALAEAFTAQSGQAGIDVRELLCVCDGRWWSLLCSDDECCPRAGTPVASGPSAYGALMTVRGRVVMASRQELADTIAPAEGALGAAMADALPRADAALADRIVAGESAEVLSEWIELYRAAVLERLPGDDAAASVIDVDVAARLIVGLGDVRVRDEVLTWFRGPRGDATRSLLIDLVRRAVVAPHDAPPLTVLAWICYLQGDGSLAGIALDRALAADADYSLAQLLDHALQRGMNPAVFRDGLDAPRRRGPLGRKRRARTRR